MGEGQPQNKLLHGLHTSASGNVNFPMSMLASGITTSAIYALSLPISINTVICLVFGDIDFHFSLSSNTFSVGEEFIMEENMLDGFEDDNDAEEIFSSLRDLMLLIMKVRTNPPGS